MNGYMNETDLIWEIYFLATSFYEMAKEKKNLFYEEEIYFKGKVMIIKINVQVSNLLKKINDLQGSI